MYVEQKQLENLRRLAAPGKVVVIYGPRRTGKTTLLKEFLKGTDVPNLMVSGEDRVADIAGEPIEEFIMVLKPVKPPSCP